MSYGGGYKRPRYDDYGQQPGYAEAPAAYGGPPVDYGHPPPMAPGPGPMGAGPAPYAGPAPEGPPMGAAGAMGAPLASGLGADADGNLPLVKLRGLPFQCDERDVRAFLEVEVVDILFVRRGGRLSGEAFVLLPGAMQADYALSKHKAYLGKRYVEVQKAFKEDYYRTIAAYVADVDAGQAPPFPRPGYGGMGGPGMAAGYGPPNGAGMAPGAYGAPAGPPGGGGGGWGGGPRGPPPMRGAPPPPHAMPSHPLGQAPGTALLKLRGLPFSATREEIAAWFNEAGCLTQRVEPDCIQLAYAYDGRPTGSAFVEFVSQEESQAAMARDKAMMGSRYVELFPSSREELAIASGAAPY